MQTPAAMSLAGPLPRPFADYAAMSEPARRSRFADIAPHLGPGLVVDRGCGTGELMRDLRAAGHEVVGVDLNPRRCTDDGVINADLSTTLFPPGTVSSVILSSVLHEVYSYAGCSMTAVLEALRVCAAELRPGGRIVIRDVWAPEDGDPILEMRFAAPVWERFRDFLARSPATLCWDQLDDEAHTVRLSERTAVEFLTKKDFEHNWDVEIGEVHSGVALGDYRAMASALHLDVIRADAVRHEWIIDSWWRRGVSGSLPRATTQVVVLQAPQTLPL